MAHLDYNKESEYEATESSCGACNKKWNNMLQLLESW